MVASDSQLKSKYESPFSRKNVSSSRSAALSSAPAVPAGLSLGHDLDGELAEMLASVKILDLARFVAGQQRQPPQAETPRFMHDVVEKRPPPDRQDRFGRLIRERPEPGAAPPDQTYSLCNSHLGPDIYGRQGRAPYACRLDASRQVV